MSTLIMKFGGTSIGTAAALTQVLSIVLHEHKRWDNLILVASALDGVTDMLLEAAHLAQVSNQRGYRRIAATLRTRHLSLVEHLPLGPAERTALQADIDRLLFEMLDVCQQVASTPNDNLSPLVTDMIACVGERLSARIIAGLLRQNELRGVAIDGTDVIITDNVHGNATPDMKATRERITQNLTPMLSRQIIPVITGFIGATREGKTTTMGRGGSDYTASILSVCTHADEVWIWSDVDGMMTTDPREIESARVIEELSYNEVAELAYFGARILHARMIRPLRENSIPLRIKNVFKPQLPGTLIRHIETPFQARIKAVTAIQGIGLSADRSGSLSEINRLVDDVLFQTTGNRADVMIASQSSARSFLCFVIPTSAGPEAVDTLLATIHDRLLEHRDTATWQASSVSIITAIGDYLDENAHLIGKIMSQIDGVKLLGIAQGPSRSSLSIVIDPADTDNIMRRIHDLALKSG